MILGLTGFSGAGKSTVASIFKEQGFYHLDCDLLVHKTVYRDPQVLKALAAAFGSDVVQNGALNRPALRACTMGDPAALKKLNETVMPFILAHIQQQLDAHRGTPIILDAPLLFESGLNQKCHKTLCVVSSPHIALKRIMERDGLTQREAEKRLSSQHPTEFYTQKCDYIIWNNDDIPALNEQALKLVKEIYDQTL